MSSNLSPNTTLALMQATQGDDSKISKGLKALKQEKDLAKVEEAARNFEAVFVSEMMKPMFDGISTEAPFGGGKGEEVFRSMMMQEYGKMIAQTGGLGISDNVMEEMIKMQEQIDSGKDSHE